MKKRDFIELWTYSPDHDWGFSFEVPKKWLKSKIKQMGYKGLNDFLSNYIWDETEFLDVEAENEGVLLNRKCGIYGHEMYKRRLRDIKEN